MLTKKIYQFLLIGILFPFSIFSQETEKEINANIEEVRIFLQGAEIIRTSQATLPKGKHKLIFTDLSPHLNASSIQVSTEGGDLNMLSTTSRVNFLKENNQTNPEIELIRDSLEGINDGIQSISNQESAYLQERKLLEQNQMLSGKEKAVDFEQLKAAAEFYRERFLAINQNLSKFKKEKNKLNTLRNKLQRQLNELNANRKPSSEIYLIVDCKEAMTTEFRLRYIVRNAGWSPIYDLTVKDLSKPINIKYRALAFNDTGVDWEEVKVILSSADPNLTATLPILTPWSLRENIPTSVRYKKDQGRLNMINQNQNNFEFNLGYGDYDDTKLGNIRFEEIEISELSTDFIIEDTYTIPANRKPYSITVNEKSLNAGYQHYSVPKMDKDAFLLGQVAGWEDLDLIPGPMNIYYDKSFIGMAELNTRNLNDTLDLSLGRDPRVLVKRVKIKELTRKQFLQNKKKMTAAYRITVKNNRDQPIDFELLDQVPVSSLKEIDVDVKEISGAQYYKNTGKLKWNFKLNPGETKTVEFSFSITYPKGKEIKLDKSRKVLTPRYY